MRELKKKQHAGLWLGGTCFFIFSVLRLPYFFMDQTQVLRVSTDAIWWAEIQLWFHRAGAGLNEEMLLRRIDFRLPTDVLMQKSMPALSHYFETDLFFINLLVTSIIFVAAIALIFLLGLRNLPSAKWASAFTLCIMFTAYIGWLRYPILVPKIFGFMMYPLVILLLLNITRYNRGYLIAGLTMLLSMLTYYVSLMYTLPAMAMASFFIGIHYRCVDRSVTIDFIVRQLLFWGLMLCVSIIALFLLKNGVASIKPPTLDITEFVSRAHRYSINKFIKDIATHMFSVLAILISGWFIFRRKPQDPVVRMQYLWCVVVFAVLISTSILAHMFASKVDLLRTTYYWRAAYYSYIPATLCLFLGLTQMPNNITVWRRSFTGKAFQKTIVLFFMLAALFSRNINFFHDSSFAEIAMPGYRSTKQSDVEDLNSLVAFARTLSKDNIVMLPPFRKQSIYSMIFEMRAMIPTVFSRKDTGDFLFKTPFTSSMYKEYSNYKTAMEIENEYERTLAVVNIARNKSVTHILVDNTFDTSLNAGELEKIFENKSWTLFSLK